MLILLRRVFLSFLYDEAFAQRLIAVGCFAVGTVLEGGGTIPGTSTVIPHLVGLFWAAAPIKWLGLYLGAGGGLPKLAPHPDQPT